MKKLICLLSFFILLCPSIIKGEQAYVVDEANILSQDEINSTQNYLEQIAEEDNINIVCYITNEYSDDISVQGADFLESLGYYDGAVLIINMNTRMYDIVLEGDSQSIAGFIEEGFEYLDYYLGNGDFEGGIKLFGSWVHDSLNYKEDDIYYNDDQYSGPNRENRLSTMLLIAAGSAAFISIVVVLFMYKQLKTEGKKYDAFDYVTPRSFNLRRSGDVFLYRNVIRRPRPKPENRSNGGGGGSHGHGSFHTGSSSSGHSFSSGGGRKF